jgi:hypothetical protein
MEARGTGENKLTDTSHCGEHDVLLFSFLCSIRNSNVTPDKKGLLFNMLSTSSWWSRGNAQLVVQQMRVGWMAGFQRLKTGTFG